MINMEAHICNECVVFPRRRGALVLWVILALGNCEVCVITIHAAEVAHDCRVQLVRGHM